MTRPPYYRDVWIFGPGNGYPGAFPNGLIDAVKRKWWGANRLWLCSGGFKDGGGTTVDIKPEVEPDIIADISNPLELPPESYDFVMLDPPYSEEESLRLYGIPYLQLGKALNEAWRLTEPGGHLLLLHRLIPISDPNLQMRQQHIVAVVGIGIVAAWSNIRALTVWRKPNRLGAKYGPFASGVPKEEPAK